MNIIERTQYSADDGETWALDEDNARTLAVHRKLAKHVDTQRSSRNWCDAHGVNWEDN